MEHSRHKGLKVLELGHAGVKDDPGKQVLCGAEIG